MIQFNKPEKLNGEQLLDELKNAGIKVVNYPLIDGEGNFWLDVEEADKEKTAKIVGEHIGEDTSKIKAAARQAILDRLGLTEEEAKILLG